MNRPEMKQALTPKEQLEVFLPGTVLGSSQGALFYMIFIVWIERILGISLPDVPFDIPFAPENISFMIPLAVLMLGMLIEIYLSASMERGQFSHRIYRISVFLSWFLVAGGVITAPLYSFLVINGVISGDLGWKPALGITLLLAGPIIAVRWKRKLYADYLARQNVELKHMAGELS